MGFVDGSLQSDTAEHIGELVFLKLHQHTQSYMASQADHKLPYHLNITVQSAVICLTVLLVLQSNKVVGSNME
jgi:hypothetical protein